MTGEIDDLQLFSKTFQLHTKVQNLKVQVILWALYWYIVIATIIILDEEQNWTFILNNIR